MPVLSKDGDLVFSWNHDEQNNFKMTKVFLCVKISKNIRKMGNKFHDLAKKAQRNMPTRFSFWGKKQ